jgi:hypothetical protein
VAARPSRRRERRRRRRRRRDDGLNLAKKKKQKTKKKHQKQKYYVQFSSLGNKADGPAAAAVGRRGLTEKARGLFLEPAKVDLHWPARALGLELARNLLVLAPERAAVRRWGLLVLQLLPAEPDLRPARGDVAVPWRPQRR